MKLTCKVALLLLLAASTGAMAADSGCALISGGAKAYGGVRKVEILSIDGVAVDGVRHRLTAGRHTLAVRMVEQLGFLQGNSRDRAYRIYADRSGHEGHRLTARGMPVDNEGARRETLPGVITVDVQVESNTRYVLGARAGDDAPEVFVYHQESWTCPGS